MMNCRIILLLIGMIFSPFVLLGQTHPGGVPGEEVWYIADEDDINTNNFTNHSESGISLNSCDSGSQNGPENLGLLNFNPAIRSDNVCMEYRAPLESSSDKNFFIVSEPKDTEDSYPLVNARLGVSNVYVPPTDALSENTYIIETNKGYGSKIRSSFDQYQNAHVYYYSWSNYDIDKKFKSYGQKGESTFTLGRFYSIPDVFEEGMPTFSGLFPEYVSFDRKLTKNERNRVESYLALKYGITKWNTDSYRSARNIVFWDAENNTLFPNNIFGIGRDDISRLNQLVCESVHKKNYLIAATEEIIENNDKMQLNFSIENENFLVFGDNMKAGLVPLNANHLQRLKKVWLAQITGDEIKRTPITFRLDINEDFDPSSIEEVVAGTKSIWMLHDGQVNNSFESDFDNENVQYYKGTINSGPESQLYADFLEERIVFDQDMGGFDQYTFAVGPNCLVEFQAEYDCSEAERGPVTCYKLHIIVVGDCKQPTLLNADGRIVDIAFNQELTDLNGHDTYTTGVCAPENYTAILDISPTEPPLEFEYETQVIGPYIVDLGPEIQYLTLGQPNILLDAGQYMTDPATTFQWFFNEEPIYHQGSTLMVEETGEYCVIVTTPDGICQIKRCVRILSDLKAEVTCHQGYCDESGNTIEINIVSGLPPYTIIIEDENGIPTSYIPDENPYFIEGLPQGSHLSRITDSLGAIFEDLCEFEDGEGSVAVSLGEDLLLSSVNTEHIIDAIALAENSPNPTYRWFRNDEEMSFTTATITVTTPGTYTVKVSQSPEDDCPKAGIQIVQSILEGTITQELPCSSSVNMILIEIDFGFPEYITEIVGINGTDYTEPLIHHRADINRVLPNGSFLVTTTDTFGNHIQQEIVFRNLMEVSLEEQLLAVCDEDFCNVNYNCNDNSDPCFVFNNSSVNEITLYADLGDVNEYFDIRWSIDGTMVSQDRQIVLYQGYDCTNSGGGMTKVELEALGYEDYKICTFTETIYLSKAWCLGEVAPRGYTSKIYPNPTDSEVTFYYNILSETGDNFSGKIEVFSMLGSLIFSTSIQGQSEYIMPYSLVASGVYIIRTTTMDGTVTVDRVIIR